MDQRDLTEGSEGLVTDLGTGSFTVTPLLPDLVVLKSVVTLSDPENGTANPKAIPGAIVLYTLDVTNTGVGAVDWHATPARARSATTRGSVCTIPTPTSS